MAIDLGVGSWGYLKSCVCYSEVELRFGDRVICELYRDGQVPCYSKAVESQRVSLRQAHLVQFHLHGDDKRLQRPLVRKFGAGRVLVCSLAGLGLSICHASPPLLYPGPKTL